MALANAVGLALGTASDLVPFVDRVTYPFILALQAIPKVATAPLVIRSGCGMQAKVVTAAVIAFFPLFLKVVTGLKVVDLRRLMLMRSLQASPLQVYLKVGVPSLLPCLFSGLGVALVFRSSAPSWRSSSAPPSAWAASSSSARVASTWRACSRSSSW